MEEDLKTLQIRAKAHSEVKEMASRRRMSMKDYIEYLIEVDQKMYKDEKIAAAKKLLEGL